MADELGPRFLIAAAGPERPAPQPAAGRSKFTVLLSAEDAADLDGLVLLLRRRLGRRVDKSAVVRTWIGMTVADADLLAELHRALIGRDH